MKTTITKMDLENMQRFVAEGLGAPEARILEAKAQDRADRLHRRVCPGKWRIRTI
ncbi:hypothetical protein HYT55_04775 [Candidatus Woesearchaeota archaeon]|nr:hypothetical protein [Candidatus Woesearchaeota archaeon]